MQVKYRTNKLQKQCTNFFEARKAYGLAVAEKLHQRIDEITAADSIEMLVQCKIGRCHPLHGNRKDQFAMDLVHPHRLVFEKYNGQLHVVQVVEIVDYH